jgi:transposase-like protein
MGHQTCICPSGFQGLADGSCVQKGCNSDPFCSVCDPIKNICSECLSSYKLTENKCVSSSKDDAVIVIVTFVLGIVFLGAILIVSIVFSLKHLKNLRNPIEES